MQQINRNNHALVLFSGGQDSAVCLNWACQHFDLVETVGFHYGQRHAIEMEIRQDFLHHFKTNFPHLSTKIGEDHIIDARVLSQLGETALTQSMTIAMNEKGLPNTFVPARNLIFFTLAGALAYRRSTRHMVGGMCETDFSGYPDCRDDTLKSLQVTLSLGLGEPTTLHTPLMFKDKGETFLMAQELGGEAFLNLILEYTHTCYMGDRTQRHAWGYGCGTCPACELRKKGYQNYRTLKQEKDKNGLSH